MLERRLLLKKMAKAEKNPALAREYDLRQKALKNILVTCFGYLGFNNFVFSNVECKEAVMLYGRVLLQRAREIAESLGLHVVYGVVDSLYVSGAARRETIGALRDKVLQETGIGLELECVFRKIVFPAAKDGSGVANKYYGLIPGDNGGEGNIEARGIKLRHSDAPPVVKRFQERACRLLLTKPWKEAIPECNELLKRHASARFPLEDYVISRRVTRPAAEYASNQPHVEALR